MLYTVFGSNGTIGKSTVSYLKKRGHDVITVSRTSKLSHHDSFGHVIYCCGVTGDFMTRPFDTIDSHISFLSHTLQSINFQSFLYLSSTRLYSGLTSGCEDNSFTINPEALDHLYNISKLAGEALCLNSNLPGIKVARLSNVVGASDIHSNNFFSNICKQALKGNIELFSTLETKRDYICIEDVVGLLSQLGPKGKKKIYNVASGTHLSTRAIIKEIVKTTDCSFKVSNPVPTIRTPLIDIKKVTEEFNFQPKLPKEWLHPFITYLCKS